MFDEHTHRVLMSIERETKTESKLRVVFKQRVGPRRTAAFSIGRVRRRRQIAAVDRRTASGVGDQQPVAEELCQQFQVRSLATTGTRARVLKQRLEKLRAFVIEPHDVGAIELGQVEEE